MDMNPVTSSPSKRRRSGAADTQRKPIHPHSRRGGPPFRLMGATRGAGALIIGDISVPVAYEIEAFTLGAVRTATGNIEGAFASINALTDREADEALACLLVLADGTRLDITVVDQDPELLAIDLPCGPALVAALGGRAHD